MPVGRALHHEAHSFNRGLENVAWKGRCNHRLWATSKCQILFTRHSIDHRSLMSVHLPESLTDNHSVTMIDHPAKNLKFRVGRKVA